MPRNGSGSYSLPQPPFVPNTVISSSAVNSDFSDIATALTQSVSADGQTTITGVLKSNLIAAPALSSATDTTSGFSATSAEADVWASGTKVLAVTPTAAAVTGNLSATGNLSVTGTSSLTGTATLGTANITTLTVSGILTDTNTGYWLPPSGNTAQRPGSPVSGAQRYNSQTTQYEFWNGTSWQVLAGIFSPNFQIFTSGSAQTYTTPTAGGNLPLYLRVRMVGGGGGGGASSTNSGTNGGDTSFGSWTALHGAGGSSGSGAGGAGGSGGASGTGTQLIRVAGAGGGGGNVSAVPGQGGASSLGGAGILSNFAGGTGVAAAANSGSGGSGGSNGSTAAAGGGAGEFVEFVVTSPASSYTYTVGTAGSGGAAGGNAGGNGAAGIIEVEAFWQ